MKPTIWIGVLRDRAKCQVQQGKVDEVHNSFLIIMIILIIVIIIVRIIIILAIKINQDKCQFFVSF